MKVCIIPARGGSKRIPRKNIKFFGGKPIIVWSIEAAIKSMCFDRIFVSTDDDEIAEISRKNGAEVPFIRPKNLSDDFAGTTEVIQHAINWQNKNGEVVEEACCIYPTAPFISADDIRYGLKILKSTKALFSVSVTTYAFPIQRALTILPNHRISMLHPENFDKRSQDLEMIWHDAGQFYWGTSSAWLEGKSFFGGDSVPVILPRYRVQDIDTPEDWERAELMFGTINSPSK
jgi:pseudaminic acid cytidylyltransferase